MAEIVNVAECSVYAGKPSTDDFTRVRQRASPGNNMNSFFENNLFKHRPIDVKLKEIISTPAGPELAVPST